MGGPNAIFWGEPNETQQKRNTLSVAVVVSWPKSENLERDFSL